MPLYGTKGGRGGEAFCPPYPGPLLCRFSFLCRPAEMRLFQRPARSRTPFQKSHSARPPARPPAFHRPGPPRQERPARLPGSPRPHGGRYCITLGRYCTAKSAVCRALPPSAAVSTPRQGPTLRVGTASPAWAAPQTQGPAPAARAPPRRLPRHCSSSGRVRGHGGGRGACPGDALPGQQGPAAVQS